MCHKELSTLPNAMEMTLCHLTEMPATLNSLQTLHTCLQCNEQLSELQKRNAELDYVQECQEYETEVLDIEEGAPQAVCVLQCQPAVASIRLWLLWCLFVVMRLLWGHQG